MTVAQKGSDSDHDEVSKSIFAYDALSRVTSEEQSILNGSSKTISYTYDKAGRRTGMTLHDGATDVAYAYDNRDRCNDIDLEGVQLAGYEWLGSAIHKRTTTCDYPGSTKPTIVSSYTRDGLSRVTQVLNELGTPNQNDKHVPPPSPPPNREYGDLGVYNYTYDAASNPLTETQLYVGNNMPPLQASREYEYDTLNRLTSADLTDSQDYSNWYSPTAVTSTWEYDDVGNRISSTERGGSSVSYTHDDANRTTEIDSSSQTYDDAGNLTKTAQIYDGGSLYYNLTYDHHNRMLSVIDKDGSTRRAAFTWDALGRRIEYIDDTSGKTKRYYYDGVNEVYEYDDADYPLRYFVHGASYIDERLAMVNCYQTTSTTDDRPYYYTLDRMYNVRMIVDRAGAIIERYMYDPYGKPLIRESGGRGDMWTFGHISSADSGRYSSSLSASIWDSRADMDDDGDVDSDDTTLYNAAIVMWSGSPTVAQAFSDVGNPYMFQGVPHFAIDTSSSDTTVKFPLNHHRARFAEPATGRWVTRDPLYYHTSIVDFMRNSLGSSGLITGRNFDYFLNPHNVLQDKAHDWSHARSSNSRALSIRFFAARFAEFNTECSLYCSLNNSPLQISDPTGLVPCVKWYGNWCGPGYCGGECLCDGSWFDRDDCVWCCGTAPPVDITDTCCQTHDNCYDTFGYYDSGCDAAMCSCLLNHVPAAGVETNAWNSMVLYFCGFNPIVPGRPVNIDP